LQQERSVDPRTPTRTPNVLDSATRSRMEAHQFAPGSNFTDGVLAVDPEVSYEIIWTQPTHCDQPAQQVSARDGWILLVVHDSHITRAHILIHIHMHIFLLSVGFLILVLWVFFLLFSERRSNCTTTN
jgi:hypothetical protein